LLRGGAAFGAPHRGDLLSATSNPDTGHPRPWRRHPHRTRRRHLGTDAAEPGDSLAIAEHAVGLGLLAEAALAGIAAEVVRDQQPPPMGEAVAEEG
jgi:hypothetical protein